MEFEAARYDTRAVSLGGYGTLVPFHGTSSFDPASPGEARYIPLPMDVESNIATVDDVRDRLEEVNKHLDVGLGQGELYYTLHYMDYGLYSSGVERLMEDLETGFELGEALKGTLEDRYEEELELHRPCFTILSAGEYGIFYLMLRGAVRRAEDESEEDEVVYYHDSGMLIDQPVTSWPNIEEVRQSDGGPITQQATEIVSEAAKLPGGVSLREVTPVDQSVDVGDADIVAARNPYDGSSVRGNDEEIVEAVEETSHLTFRIRGGTVGFEDEEEFITSTMSVFRPKEVTMWGAPLVICFPLCSAKNN